MGGGGVTSLRLSFFTGEVVDDGDISQSPPQEPSSPKASRMSTEPGAMDENDENGVTLETRATGRHGLLSEPGNADPRSIVVNINN